MVLAKIIFSIVPYVFVLTYSVRNFVCGCVSVSFVVMTPRFYQFSRILVSTYSVKRWSESYKRIFLSPSRLKILAILGSFCSYNQTPLLNNTTFGFFRYENHYWPSKVRALFWHERSKFRLCAVCLSVSQLHQTCLMINMKFGIFWRTSFISKIFKW